jgi:hypothetical protein
MKVHLHRMRPIEHRQSNTLQILPLFCPTVQLGKISNLDEGLNFLVSHTPSATQFLKCMQGVKAHQQEVSHHMCYTAN